MSKPLNLLKFMGLLLFQPIKGFYHALNKNQYKYVYLLIVLFGVLQGINKATNQLSSFESHIILANTISSIFITLISSFILCFLISGIIYIIGYYLKGLANYRMTLSVVSYSLIPLIIGSFLSLLFKFLYFNLTILSLDTLNSLLSFLYPVFFIWTLYILIVGYLIVNKFSFVQIKNPN